MSAAPPTEAEIRQQIRRSLPAGTFARQPRRALWFIPLAGLVIAGTAAIIAFDLAWYWALPMALVLGHCYGAMGFLAHEVLHGSVVRSKRLQTFLGAVGFGPMLVSPSLWRAWHVRIHHGNTNKGNQDPDSFGTLDRYERVPSTRFVTRLAPGSGRWYSFLFLFYWFSFHAQIVLWIQTQHMRAFKGYDRRRAIIDTFLFLALWVAIGILAGPVNSLFVIAIPLMVSNFLVMSYISTNHFMRPQAGAEDSVLESSMGVRTHRILDRMHFNFSHHVEHHLWPGMSPRFVPRVRQWLEAHVGERYVCPPHWKALRHLYATPRVYLDANTLVDPSNLDRQVDITELTLQLQ